MERDGFLCTTPVKTPVGPECMLRTILYFLHWSFILKPISLQRINDTAPKRNLRKLVSIAKTSLPEKYTGLLDRFCYLQERIVADYPECRYPMLKRGVRQLYGGQEELLSVLKYIERVVKSVSFSEWWKRDF
jgi:hypothetical protein